MSFLGRDGYGGAVTLRTIDDLEAEVLQLASRTTGADTTAELTRT